MLLSMITNSQMKVSNMTELEYLTLDVRLAQSRLDWAIENNFAIAFHRGDLEDVWNILNDYYLGV